MADKNIKKISDEELEEVAGGGHRPGAGQFTKMARAEERKKKAFVEEAKNQINPNNPLSWFQTVADLFNERGGIK